MKECKRCKRARESPTTRRPPRESSCFSWTWRRSLCCNAWFASAGDIAAAADLVADVVSSSWLLQPWTPFFAESYRFRTTLEKNLYVIFKLEEIERSEKERYDEVEGRSRALWKIPTNTCSFYSLQSYQKCPRFQHIINYFNNF